MKKIQMQNNTGITFEEVCNKYLDNCRERNLRQGTINHYRQSYNQFYKYFDAETNIKDIDQKAYNAFVLYLRKTLNNDVSINAYLRTLITTLHFAMNEGYLEPYVMKSIKVDEYHVDTYTDDELIRLLKKPNLKKCNFTEYQCWVIINFLFSTGVRQRSLINIQVKDLDFDNNIVYVNVTKNRKQLIIPLNNTMVNILKEYLRYRQHKENTDYLFCNAFGSQLTKSTSYHMIYDYNIGINSRFEDYGTGRTGCFWIGG